MRETLSADPLGLPAIVEVFSNSARAWFVAIVVNAADGILTVRFFDTDGAKREKAAYREDPRLARFGTHIGVMLPPGFTSMPSSTRPGELAYVDSEVHRKYASPELAWQAYLQRHLLDGIPESPPPMCAGLAPSASSSPMSPDMNHALPMLLDVNYVASSAPNLDHGQSSCSCDDVTAISERAPGPEPVSATNFVDERIAVNREVQALSVGDHSMFQSENAFDGAGGVIRINTDVITNDFASANAVIDISKMHYDGGTQERPVQPSCASPVLRSDKCDNVSFPGTSGGITASERFQFAKRYNASTPPVVCTTLDRRHPDKVKSVKDNLQPEGPVVAPVSDSFAANNMRMCLVAKPSGSQPTPSVGTIPSSQRAVYTSDVKVDLPFFGAPPTGSQSAYLGAHSAQVPSVGAWQRLADLGGMRQRSFHDPQVEHDHVGAYCAGAPSVGARQRPADIGEVQHRSLQDLLEEEASFLHSHPQHRSPAVSRPLVPRPPLPKQMPFPAPTASAQGPTGPSVIPQASHGGPERLLVGPPSRGRQR